MYSDVLSWLVMTLGGVRLDESRCGGQVFLLEPEFLDGIDHAELHYRTAAGNIHVAWKRQGKQVLLAAEKDPGVKLVFRNADIKEEKITVTVKL